MDQEKIKQLVLQTLKADSRLWDEDKTELNQILLLELLEEPDEKVICLLLNEADLRDGFFAKIQGAYVFKSKDFRFFMEENKVDNSYTSYRNRIGLTDGKRLLKDSGDVVLDFPYKDCVLEGGQSSEADHDTYFEYEDAKSRTIQGKKTTDPAGYKEKTSKRKEIFFNQVLAASEIDRLFDHKALVNWKRLTQDGEQRVIEIKRDKDGTIRENLIIKGNNLLALHSLKRQLANKVKLIYIDPPYNTGNDSFNYNDNFSHSTWLSFMKNRLEVARQLLRDDGVIFVQCDDNEQAYLKVLMDEVFGRSNFVNNFTWVNNLKGRQISNHGAAKTHEFILCYAKTIAKIDIFRGSAKELKKIMPDIYKGFDYQIKEDEKGKYVTKNELYNSNSAFNEETRPTLVFNIHHHQKTGAIKISNVDDSVNFDNFLKIEPKKNNDGKHKYHAWRWGKEKILREKFNLEFKGNRIYTKVRDFESTVVKDIIINIKANGNSELKTLLANNQFDYPKPEDLLKLIIAMSTNTGDIILDYHLGSGTTPAVAHKMGRQYIGIEQMDYIETIVVERLKKVINGEQGGISKAVNWQGGGDFIYCELAKWNETAKEKINTCQSLVELEKLFDELYNKYFLNYNLKIKEFKDKIIKEKEFSDLSLTQQKKMFLTMLDLNQMYVNKTEMADKKYGIAEKDQRLTTEFYN